MYTGVNDNMVSTEDAYWMASSVKGIKKYREFEGFDHGTFCHFHDFPWLAYEILEAFRKTGIKPVPPVKPEERRNMLNNFLI